MIEFKDQLTSEINSLLNTSVENHSVEVNKHLYRSLVVVLDDVLTLELIRDEIGGVYLFKEYLKGVSGIPDPICFESAEDMIDYTKEAIREYLESSGRIRKLYEE